MQKIFFRTPLLYSRGEKSAELRNSGGVVNNSRLDTKSRKRRLAIIVNSNCLSEALERCKSDLSAEKSQCLSIYQHWMSMIVTRTAIEVY